MNRRLDEWVTEDRIFEKAPAASATEGTSSNESDRKLMTRTQRRRHDVLAGPGGDMSPPHSTGPLYPAAPVTSDQSTTSKSAGVNANAASKKPATHEHEQKVIYF